MNDENYRPISCDLHDQIEAAILAGQPINLVWHGDDGMTHIERLRLKDVTTSSGEEWLDADSPSGDHVRVRLDHIVRLGDEAPQA